MDSKDPSRRLFAMRINIKEELPKINKNNFTEVTDFVDKIVNDILINSHNHVELIDSMMRDYMVNLINPEFLDFEIKD